MERPILFINACVRKESRTRRLAEKLLLKLDRPYEEIRLDRLNFPAVTEEYLRMRDRLITETDFTDPMFDLARQFAEAETIVIASPYWDLSFPASLKQYLELVNVVGISFRYTEEGIPVGLCRADRLGSVGDGRTPAESGGRKDRGQNDGDAVGTSQLGHRDDVAECEVFAVGALILSHVVGTRVDDHHRRLQIDDILTETNQHLRRDLATDAAAHITVGGEEIRPQTQPFFRDGVSHQNDTRLPFGGRCQRSVRCSEALQSAPILGIGKKGRRDQSESHNQRGT